MKAKTLFLVFSIYIFSVSFGWLVGSYAEGFNQYYYWDNDEVVNKSKIDLDVENTDELMNLIEHFEEVTSTKTREGKVQRVVVRVNEKFRFYFQNGKLYLTTILEKKGEFAHWFNDPQVGCKLIKYGYGSTKVKSTSTCTTEQYKENLKKGKYNKLLGL